MTGAAWQGARGKGQVASGKWQDRAALGFVIPSPSMHHHRCGSCNSPHPTPNPIPPRPVGCGEPREPHRLCEGRGAGCEGRGKGQGARGKGQGARGKGILQNRCNSLTLFDLSDGMSETRPGGLGVRNAALDGSISGRRVDLPPGRLSLTSSSWNSTRRPISTGPKAAAKTSHRAYTVPLLTQRYFDLVSGDCPRVQVDVET